VAEDKEEAKVSFVMYQHQHAPLLLERLKDVAQPVVVLLEKYPARRFQNPSELLNAMPLATELLRSLKLILDSSRNNMVLIPELHAP